MGRTCCCKRSYDWRRRASEYLRDRLWAASSLPRGCTGVHDGLNARLLYVVNIPRFFYTHRLSLALAAQAAGYEVHVATSDADADSIERICQAGLPFHPLPLAQHGTNPLMELRTLAALLALYRRLRPQIVHLVSIKPVIYGGVAARVMRVPATVGAMSGLGYVFIGDDWKRRVIRMGALPLMRFALGGGNARMVFQNPDDQARLLALGVLPPEKAVLVKGSGVDPQRFRPQPEAAGQSIVLFAGRLMAQKGLLTFVEAARRLRGRARFVVVGIPEPTNPSAVSPEQVAAWAQEGLIEWWGQRDDMPDVIAQAHVVALPSVYGEGVPRILIEAAACARPIVTTDTPGCREIVHHEDNGLLVPPHDVEAFVRALERLLSDPPLRQRLGLRGRERVLAEFTLQHVNDQMLSLYAQLLSCCGR